MWIIRKIKILLIHINLSTFVNADLEILERHFDVKVLRFTNIKQDFLKLLAGVLWADVTFSWFAGSHAFYAIHLSKILGKKSIVVLGGYEVANLPEIEYGALTNLKSARRVKYVLNNCNIVIAVDNSLKSEAITNIGISGDNIAIVPTGYNSNKWDFKGQKEDLVVTVGIINWSVMKRKGFETFIKAAEYLPNLKFVLIGKSIDDSINYLKSIASKNVDFTGFVSEDELINYYQRAKVYCQLSLHEGLPNALCEAMLCECVPVGTQKNGIVTAIGNIGFYSPYGDPRATAEVIEKAMNSDKGKEARERIIKMFPTEKREKKLIEIIHELGNKT